MTVTVGRPSSLIPVAALSVFVTIDLLAPAQEPLGVFWERRRVGGVGGVSGVQL